MNKTTAHTHTIIRHLWTGAQFSHTCIKHSKKNDGKVRKKRYSIKNENSFHQTKQLKRARN